MTVAAVMSLDPEFGDFCAVDPNGYGGRQAYQRLLKEKGPRRVVDRDPLAYVSETGLAFGPYRDWLVWRICRREGDWLRWRPVGRWERSAWHWSLPPIQAVQLLPWPRKRLFAERAAAERLKAERIAAQRREEAEAAVDRHVQRRLTDMMRERGE